MPRELYAIRQVGTGGSKIWTKRLERWPRGREREFPKSYSNALSSGCRRKLETILKASSTSPEESEDRFEKGHDGGRRETGFLRDGSMSEKHYTLFMSSLPIRVYCSKSRCT